jgi:hypothetical protein
MAIFDKNGGCVAIDHRPDAHKEHYALHCIDFERYFRGSLAIRHMVVAKALEKMLSRAFV